MISAKIIQDSVTLKGDRITTFELEYPRFIHSELMTHRQFSRNAASSRAVPIERMIKHVHEHPAEPVHWGKNQPGMQAKVELEGEELALAKHGWRAACASACEWSAWLSSQGVHKQIANRVTEPFQTMKTVVTATEYHNWFWLRHHADAQPEIYELADKMHYAMWKSHPTTIYENEWHVPYVKREFDTNRSLGITYMTDRGEVLTVSQARKVSASCCAQVSYRLQDDSVEKAEMIFDKLITSQPAHASPVEHQATPVVQSTNQDWPHGVTHQDREGYLWSGNFKHWSQYRKILGL